MAKRNDMISSQNSGLFQDLVQRLKLILRLLGDGRVSPLLKLLPIAAAIYVISPVDLLPGAVLPLIGALDDAAVIWIGTSLFVALCPDDIVQEHSNALNRVVDASWRDTSRDEEAGAVIDAEPTDRADGDQASG